MHSVDVHTFVVILLSRYVLCRRSSLRRRTPLSLCASLLALPLQRLTHYSHLLFYRPSISSFQRYPHSFRAIFYKSSLTRRVLYSLYRGPRSFIETTVHPHFLQLDFASPNHARRRQRERISIRSLA